MVALSSLIIQITADMLISDISIGLTLAVTLLRDLVLCQDFAIQSVAVEFLTFHHGGGVVS